MFAGITIESLSPSHLVLGENNIALDSVVFLLIAGSYQFLVSLYVKDELAHLHGSCCIFLYALADGSNSTVTQEERNLAVSVELAHLLMMEAESLTALTGIASVGYAVAL
jgi:hypothetical protein